MTESVRPLVERLRGIAEIFSTRWITQRAADDSARPAFEVIIPTRELDAAMKAMREAADALVSAEGRITALEESVIAAMSALGSGNCTVNVCEGCKADEDMAYRELREAIGDKLPAELKTFARGGNRGAQRGFLPHRTSGDS